MIVRRIAGAFVAMLALHLSVTGPITPCGQHAESAAADESMTEHHHGSPMTMPTPSAPEIPVETPSRAECCGALSSCAISLAEDSSGNVGVSPPHGAILSGLLRAPVAQILSPDPPPPKA
jgi:hypothetical protein